MFKSIDVWQKVNEFTALRYRCFQRLDNGHYCVQSIDSYHLPIRENQRIMLDQQFIELFIEESPDQRSPLYPTLAEAIAAYDEKG